METKKPAQEHVIKALGEHNLSSVLFRNVTSRRLGLNIADMECLSLLAQKGISTPTELSRHTGLTTGSTTAMLDRLEKAGLLRRKPNPMDRRGVIIEVEEHLSEILKPTFVDIQKIQVKLIASYSEQELEIIADFLTRFSDNVKQYTETIEKDLGK